MLSLGAKTTYLTEGGPVEGFLNGGQGIDYHLDLESQDLGVLSLETMGFGGGVTVFDPAGMRVRGWKVDDDGRRSLAFVADSAGDYRLVLEAAPESGAGGYRLVLDRVLPLEERVKLKPKPSLESPRLRRLAEALRVAPAALSAFWREVEAEGAPLMEPDPGDPRLTLCTFLWRGTKQIQNVRVHLLYRTTLPNDYAMKQMEGTDLWHATIQLPSQGRFGYTLLVNTPPGPKPDMDSAPSERLIYFAASQADPLNPRRCYDQPGSRYESQSLLELPQAPPQPWTDPRPAVPRGIVQRYPFKSDVLADERFVSVYTPPGYSGQVQPYGLLLVFDEEWYLSRVSTPTILDNLLADGEIPPLVAVIIGNGPGKARNRQLPCNPSFAEFMAEELLPGVRRQYHLSGDPGRTIVAGSSYGGLAAAYVALQYPGKFGNVLSLSGSYWWRPSQQSGSGKGEHFPVDRNYLASLVIERPRLKLQFYLAAGSGEIDPTGEGRSILDTNRHLRDVLLAKGYPVHYQEFVGGHDFLSWRMG